jgi:hypothetical protein
MAKATQLTLENLRLLDFGKIGIMFQHHLERCVKDMLDRPGEKKARDVVIRFRMMPNPVVSGNTIDLENVKIAALCESSVPKHTTQVYTMDFRNDGSLVFNPDLPDEPDGQTLFEEQERKEDSGQPESQ